MLLAAIVGFLAGFISAVPVAGPISAYVFSLGMRGKIAQGRAVALGAGLAEAVYAFLAFWGFSQLGPKSPRLFFISNLVAALILAGLGVYFYRSKKLRQSASSKRVDAARTARAFALGLGISAMNISLLATWAALIGTLYSIDLLEFSTANGAFFAGGVGGGIFVWFGLLLALIAKYRDRFQMSVLDRFLKVFGVALVLLSLGMSYRLAASSL